MAQRFARGGFANPTTALSITIPSTTAGDTLIVKLWHSSSVSVSSITDNKSGGSSTYTLRANRTQLEIWTTPNCAAGITQVTINLSASAACTAIVEARDDIDSAATLDTSVSAETSGTSWTTGNSSTTTNAVAVAIGATWEGDGSSPVFSPGGTYTADSGTGISGGNVANTAEGDVLFGQWKALTSTGAYASDGTVDTSVTSSCLLAIFKGVEAGQTADPDADVSDGAWTASTGSDLYAMLDDGASPSDSDYISVNSNSTCEIGLGTLSTPGAGDRTLHYRHSGAANKKLTVDLYEGASLVQSWSHDPCPSSLTTSDQAITNAISSYADLRVKFTTADATSPPSPTITFGAIGTGANGSTSVAPSYPSGITAGQYLVCVVTSGGSANPTPSTPSGWTLLATGASTDGTWGVDAGPRRVTVFGKVAAGSESGTLSVTITGGNTCRGTISRFTKSQATYSWDVVAQGGNDSTSGTGFSAATSAIDWAVGDATLVAVGQRVDSATQSSQSLTASGITFGTRTNRASTAVTTGNDHRHVVDTFAAITAGSGSAAPTWAYTASASVSGGVVIVRLREAPPAEAARVTWARMEVPEAGEGATVVAAGIASAEAFGSPSIAAAIASAGASSAEAIGQPTIAASVGAAGIASGEAIGQPAAGTSIVGQGIASAEAFGSPSLSAQVTSAGIASAEAVGSPSIAAGASIVPSGIASAEAAGAPAIAVTIESADVASAEAIGQPALAWVGSLVPGKGPALALRRRPIASQPKPVTLRPSGIASAEAFGRPSVSVRIGATAIARVDGASVRGPSVAIVLRPSSIESSAIEIAAPRLVWRITEERRLAQLRVLQQATILSTPTAFTTRGSKWP